MRGHKGHSTPDSRVAAFRASSPAHRLAATDNTVVGDLIHPLDILYWPKVRLTVTDVPLSHIKCKVRTSYWSTFLNWNPTAFTRIHGPIPPSTKRKPSTISRSNVFLTFDPFWRLSVPSGVNWRHFARPHRLTKYMSNMCNLSKVFNQAIISLVHHCFSIICISIYAYSLSTLNSGGLLTSNPPLLSKSPNETRELTSDRNR